MPTYQYACTECGHALEAQQSFTDDPLSTCPECSGRLRKVFSAVGVVFKGSGFYRNDSRSDAAAATSDSGNKSDSAAKESTTTADKKTPGSTPGKGAEKKSTSTTPGTSSSGSSSGSAA